VGACIIERAGGAPAVFHDRRDRFGSMAVRVCQVAGHDGRPCLALAAVLGGPDSLMPALELTAIRTSHRVESEPGSGRSPPSRLFGGGGGGFTFGHCLVEA
jgi:hypothetical protein